MNDYTHADCYSEDEVTELRGELIDHQQVIARLLDGWTPFLGEPPKTEGPLWAERFGNGIEPMSDGEAAIIRAHQEKNV